MKSHLECIPCFLKQALEATRMVTDDEGVQTNVMSEVMKHLQTISFTESPPKLSRDVHKIVRDVTRSNDPYKQVKDRSNERAKRKYAYLKAVVRDSDDPLRTALKLSIVGNVIDYGTTNRFDVDSMIDTALTQEIDERSYRLFTRMLKQSKTILFLADNAGEIIYDKLLVEELIKTKKKITYVIKKNPIINDALEEDAKFAGIDRHATVIAWDSNQTESSPGIILPYASEHFLNLFESADMVLSKGQGNYEGLSDVKRDICFLLVVKCPIVAQDIKDNLGKFILKVKQ